MSPKMTGNRKWSIKVKNHQDDGSMSQSYDGWAGLQGGVFV